MTEQVDRVSMWQNRDSPLFNVGPAKLAIEDDYAVIRVSPRRWPQGLPSSRVIGWPVLASERDEDADADRIHPCTTVYEGEIHAVEETGRMSGIVRKLQCKPARDAQSQTLPGLNAP